MNQGLFPENELLSFTKPSLIIYVEKSYNAELNAFIQENYNEIVVAYNAKNIDFCYVPYLLQSKGYQAVVSYNRPYLQTSNEQLQTQQIYDSLISKQKSEINESALLLYATFGFFDKLIAAPIDDKIITFDLFLNVLKRATDYIERTRNDLPQFQIVSNRDESDEEPDDRIMYSLDVNEATSEYKPEFKRIAPADYSFGREAYIIADEIRTRIQFLKESNSLSLIGDILEEIQGAKKKLSTVFITNDYRIFLKDYGMKEIVMPPLPKSLFILFLRHPEGILFKQLSDYHDELLSIYRNVTVHENIDRAIESIRAMTDPMNNSINEKCSRIRAAFLEVITDDLAQNYYVTGKRGEPKKIIIDRSLVEFQK